MDNTQLNQFEKILDELPIKKVEELYKLISDAGMLINEAECIIMEHNLSAKMACENSPTIWCAIFEHEKLLKYKLENTSICSQQA